jgi:hypothetical protein
VHGLELQANAQRIKNEPTKRLKRGEDHGKEEKQL